MRRVEISEGEKANFAQLGFKGSVLYQMGCKYSCVETILSSQASG